MSKEITNRAPGRRHVILCCDCEGTREQLDRIIGAIDGHGVPANWFFVGETVREFPEIVRDVASRHQVESHSMTHPNLRTLAKEEQRREIMGGRRAVEECIGRPTRGFRAPMHQINRNTMAILNEEGFVFDASRLYFRWLSTGKVAEVTPTWFREWMPLYDMLKLHPRTAFGWFLQLVRMRRLSVLPVHPHYAGLRPELAEGFSWFIGRALAEGATFWSIDEWLAQENRIPRPGWMPPVPAKGRFSESAS